MTVCSMTRSKVKVTSPSKLEIRQFSKAVCSGNPSEVIEFLVSADL